MNVFLLETPDKDIIVMQAIFDPEILIFSIVSANDNLEPEPLYIPRPFLEKVLEFYYGDKKAKK